MKPKYHQYFFDSVMQYGKYRGETIKTILAYDPGYIQWMLKKVGANFHPNVVKRMRHRIKIGATKEFFDQLERNFHPGNVYPDRCPKAFPEIDLLQVEGIPLIFDIPVENNFGV